MSRHSRNGISLTAHVYGSYELLTDEALHIFSIWVNSIIRLPSGPLSGYPYTVALMKSRVHAIGGGEGGLRGGNDGGGVDGGGGDGGGGDGGGGDGGGGEGDGGGGEGDGGGGLGDGGGGEGDGGGGLGDGDVGGGCGE